MLDQFDTGSDGITTLKEFADAAKTQFGSIRCWRC